MNKSQIRGTSLIEEIMASGSIIVYKCAVETDFSLIDISENVERILGYKPNEFIERKRFWTDIIHPDDYKNVVSLFRNGIYQKGKDTLEYRLKKKDGEYIWVRDEVHLTKNKNGVPIYISGICVDTTNMKNKEDCLSKKASKQYESVVDNINEVIFQTDESGYWTYLNPAWEKLTGYPIPESIGNKFITYQHPEDREKSEKYLQSIIESRSDHYQNLTRYKTKSGKYKWVEAQAWLQYDKDNNILGSAGILSDVTERERRKKEINELNNNLEKKVKQRTKELQRINRELKKEVRKREQAEKKLIEQRDQLLLLEKAISELSEVVILTKATSKEEADPKIIYVNDAYERLTGFKKEEILGKAPDVLWKGPFDKNRIDHIINEIINKGEVRNLEVLNKTKDGHDYWHHFDVILFQVDGSEALYGVTLAHDITQQKIKERQLQESEEKYKILVDQSFDAILEIGMDWKILDCNKSAARIFGYTKQELMQMKITDLMPAENTNQLPEYFEEKLLSSDKVGESTKIKKDGTRITVEFNTKMVNVNDQKRVIAYIRDITDRKRKEELIKGQYEILEMIARKADLSDILENIACLIGNQSTDIRCAILTLNKYKDQFKVGAAPEMPEKFHFFIENSPFEAKGASKEAVKSCKTVFVEDINSVIDSNRNYEILYNMKVHALSSTPIFSSRNEVLGVFTLYYSDNNPYKGISKQWIDIATNLAGIAIEQSIGNRRINDINNNLAKAQRIAKMGSWDWDIDRDIIQWSDEIYHIFEVDVKTPVRTRKDYQTLFPDVLNDEINKAFERAVLNNETSFKLSYPYKTKNDKEKRIYQQVNINYNEEGKPVSLNGIVQDITERYETSRELAKLSMVASKTSNGVLITDAEGKVDWVNEAFSRITGYTLQEIKGEKASEVMQGPETQDSEAQKLDQARREFKPVTVELINYRKNGEKYWAQIVSSPIMDFDYNFVGSIILHTDITDKKKYELDLKQSLEEKEVLLAEIHHRVKNNLAVISGLMELQTLNTDHEDIRKILGDSQNRVKSIALIHEKLYHSETLSKINFENYIKDLIKNISDSIKSDCNDIQVNTRCSDISLNVNQAVPCGLILNELIINAYQHAFDEQKNGKIDIYIENRDDSIYLTLQDNGRGLPEDLNLHQPKSLGLKLVSTLVKQLKGKIAINNGNGTKYVITFPWEKV